MHQEHTITVNHVNIVSLANIVIAESPPAKYHHDARLLAMMMHVYPSCLLPGVISVLYAFGVISSAKSTH